MYHSYTYKDVLDNNVPSDICHNPIIILIASVAFYGISQDLTLYIHLTFVTKEWLGGLFGGRVILFVYFNHCYPLARGSLVQG
jgi:hypothetical protein